MKNYYKIATVLFVLQLIFAEQKMQAQTYATLPFSENFENVWVNQDATRDVPSAYWKNTPATTDSSWSRDDDGVARGAWIYPSGMYNFPGANNTLHSARFHSYYAKSTTSGKLDLYVNFSNYIDSKTLTFWYVNQGGSDKLEVFLSTDGGVTFGSALTSQQVASTWTKISVNLGSIVSPTCVIRFKATSDYGTSDIGIDEVNINTPTTPVTTDFKTDSISGMSPVPIKFIDTSSPDVTTWSWDFNNDGIIDATIQNPIFRYTTAGTYTVKLTASKPGSSNSIIKTNLITVKPSEYAPLPFTESFENYWINRDTIGDVPSLYFSSNPVSGVNSWSSEADPYRAWHYGGGIYTPAGAKGSKHSARFHSYEATNQTSGILDAYIDFSSQTGDKVLTYFYNNSTGADKLEVFVSTDGGLTFGPAISTMGIAATWTKVSVDLGTVSSATGIVRFKATSDINYDLSDIGLDEIHIENPAASPVIADFIANTTSGLAPLSVNFSDLSSGAPTSWSWDLNNDGTIDATTQNPSYIYTNPGIYSAKLVASKTGSSSEKNKISYIYVGGYASLPFSENFDNSWLSRDDIRDVPSLYVKNTPATSNNSWSRDDDGFARGAWHDDIGAFSPSGANGSSHSARFHSYYTNSSGSLDFYINFSTITGNKTLTYWYINPDGTDNLNVYLSTDGGNSFGSVLSSQSVNTVWTQVSVDLGNITASNGIIRFVATGDNGDTDIGIDEVSVGTTGVTPIHAAFSENIVNGTAPLAVNFTDQSTGGPTTWAWDFNNDGITDATTQNPSYTFSNPGIYSVSLTASKSGAASTEIKSSFIFAGGYSSLPFSENFDHFWGNRDDINDVPSAYAKNTPASGYNSWASDGDAYSRWGETDGEYSPEGAIGSSGSARFHSYNTYLSGSLDFYINFSSVTGNKTLNFWYINPEGDDSLTVNLSVDGGSTFGKALVTKKISQNWTQVTVNLGNITATNGILRFKAFGDYGNSDIGIDEISLVVPVGAQFTANTVTGVAPLTVNFTDQSTGIPTTWKWDFNHDGTVDATTQNPSYTYTTPGTYAVKLVVSDPNSADSLVKTAYITVSAPVSAQFITDISSGVAPLTVKFTDQSTGNPTAWSWDFNNDGTIDATTQNPSYTFTTPGTYDVKLIASKTGSTDTQIKTALITVTTPVIALFTSDVTTGVAPLMVNFTDQSTGNPTAWSWDFNNDGTVDATTQNPSYTFTIPGTYEVKLVASKTGSTNTQIKTSYIIVSAPVIALFTSDVTTGIAPLKVNFTDQSTGNPTSWSWDFNNDGTIDATTQNPSYTFTNPGTYEVKLVASKTGSTNTIIKTAYITVNEPVTAMFTADKTSGNAPLTVNFTDQSTGNPTTWSWDFNNDGTVDATTQNPSYTFANSGTFTVKLVVSKTGSTDTQIKTGYIVVSSATGISTINGSNGDINIYPNPTSGMIFIDVPGNLKDESLSMEIFDNSGQKKAFKVLDHQLNYQVDLSGYTGGVYTLRFVSKTRVITKQVLLR